MSRKNKKLYLPFPLVLVGHEEFTVICYRPQCSCGKVMFLHVSVILSTGGCGSQTHPPGQTPPQADNPLNNHPLWQTSPGQTPPGQTPPTSRRPPTGRHPPAASPPGTATAADGTHPTRMHSCYPFLQFRR